MAIEQEVADEAALAALSVSDADVTKGKEVRVLSNGDIYRPVRSGAGAALWMKLTALYNSVTGAIPIAFGTYTATIAPVTNVSGQTFVAAFYARLGSIVIVFVAANITPTSTGATTWTISLPVASNFTDANQAIGVATGHSATNNGFVNSDATNDVLVGNATFTSAVAQTVRHVAGYRVL